MLVNWCRRIMLTAIHFRRGPMLPRFVKWSKALFRLPWSWRTSMRVKTVSIWSKCRIPWIAQKVKLEAMSTCKIWKIRLALDNQRQAWPRVVNWQVVRNATQLSVKRKATWTTCHETALKTQSTKVMTACSPKEADKCTSRPSLLAANLSLQISSLASGSKFKKISLKTMTTNMMSLVRSTLKCLSERLGRSALIM